MNFLVPIFICAVMPTLIVLLVMQTVKNRDNKRAEIIIEATRNNNIDIKELQRSLSDYKTPAQRLLSRLLISGLFSFIGIALLAVYGVLGYLDPQKLGDGYLFLLGGIICVGVGISYYIVYRLQKKMMKESISKDEE